MDLMGYSLGIDPAYRTCAFVLLDEDGEVIKSVVMDTASMELGELPARLEDWLGEVDIKGACVERFVAFKDLNVSHSEQILMVIGQLQYWLYKEEIPFTMWRSYDWKSRLSKHLFKDYDFRNPSDRMDKVFSVAAAECCTGVKFETDHEADAGCLAYLAGAMYA